MKMLICSFLVSFYSVIGKTQTLKIDSVSLNILKNGKIELLIDKINETENITRRIRIERILESKKDFNNDITDVVLNTNDYNLTWDGIKGVYKMTVIFIKNGKTTVKSGTIKFY